VVRQALAIEKDWEENQKQKISKVEHGETRIRVKENLSQKGVTKEQRKLSLRSTSTKNGGTLWKMWQES
jgi:hypothetical protein